MSKGAEAPAAAVKPAHNAVSAKRRTPLAAGVRAYLAAAKAELDRLADALPAGGELVGLETGIAVVDAVGAYASAMTAHNKRRSSASAEAAFLFSRARTLEGRV